MTRAHGYDFLMPTVFESTYGTSPGSGYTYLPISNFGLQEKRPFEKDPRLGLGRGRKGLYQGRRDVQGAIEAPASVAEIGYWLKHGLGAPSTTGTGPYTHTFNTENATLPAMSIEGQHSNASLFEMFAGVKQQSMMWKFTDDGAVLPVFNCIGQACTPDSSTAAGSPASETYEAFRQYHASIDLDSSSLGNVLSAEFTYDNGLNAERLVEGAAKIDEPDLDDNGLTGKLNMRFADTTLYDKAVAATSVALDFVLEISASKKLTFTMPEVYLTPVGVPVNGPGGLDISFDFEAVYNSGAGYKMQAVLINAVSAY